jgi:hypothetical protein
VKWTKKGLMVPAPPPLRWAASHAALPAVLRLSDGGLRIYFSSRDDHGRSHIAAGHVEAQAALESVTYSPEPVLSPGPLGVFDDAGVTSACVVPHDGLLYQYYSGWSLGISVPFYFFIGCAVSDDDGLTFRKTSSSPLLDRGPADPFLTASPWVLIENGTWRMWYVSGTGWDRHQGRPRHWYHIKYAESGDGLHWERRGQVCIDYRDGEHAIARPCVIRDGGLYRMWYCARGENYRLGYAESADGIAWKRKDDDAGLDPSASGWDSEMVAYPCIFDRDNMRYLLYNGNAYGATGFGYAVGEPYE